MAIDFTTLPDLCDERLGSAVVGRNDEYFALADNLLKPEAPVFVPDKFTKRGKWMDGWETRRRRSPGVDWCIVRLGAPGVVRGIVVDTAHFTGNHPQESGSKDVRRTATCPRRSLPMLTGCPSARGLGSRVTAST